MIRSVLDIGIRNAVAALLSFALVIGTSAAARAAIPCPIKLGNVRAETGAGAAYGQALATGLKMGFDEINAAGGVAGCPVELVTYDSQSQPGNAATLTQRLLYQDQVPLILSSSLSLEVLAMMELTESAQIPLYVASAASAKITNQGAKWVWRQSIIDLGGAKALASYIAKDRGEKKIGIIFENTDYGKVPVNTVLIPELKRLGVDVADVESFNPGDSDLTSPLLHIRDSGATSLVFWGRDKEGALAMRELVQLGMNIPVFGNTGIVYPAFLDLLPEDVQAKLDFTGIGQFVWTDPDPKVKSWIEKYSKEFNRRPDATSIDGYDAAFVVKKAIESAGDLAPADLQKALSTVSYDGVGGAISFDKNGQARRPFVIVKMTPKSGLGYEVVKRIPPDAP
jgi:branched-chain amino acid transport system substrate-binding protein